MENGNLINPVKIPWHLLKGYLVRNVTIFSFSFDIEECKDCDCDKLTYSSSYFSITSSNAKCARRTSRYQDAMYMQEADVHPDDLEIGRDIWFRFVSDDTVFYKGFNLSYIVRSETRKLIPNGLTAREITYNNFEISLVVCQVSLQIMLLPILILARNNSVNLSFQKTFSATKKVIECGLVV